MMSMFLAMDIPYQKLSLLKILMILP